MAAHFRGPSESRLEGWEIRPFPTRSTLPSPFQLRLEQRRRAERQARYARMALTELCRIIAKG